jgi:antibiotic biosynthesis monooxygenase (ABM) superfamily enzyme
MVRVIIERELKHGEDIGLLLGNLNMMAVLQNGHLASEILVNPENNRCIAVMSTWQKLEDWTAWESSPERLKITQTIDPLIAGSAQVKIYSTLSPDDCAFFEDPSGWIQEHEHPHFEG